MGTVTMLKRPARTILLAQMENIKQNFILGLAAVSLLESEASLPVLEKSSCTIGPYYLDFSQVAATLRKPGDKALLLQEFIKYQLRTLVRESFSTIERYCCFNGYTARLEKQPWYEYARIIDHCLSCNCRFNFCERDKAVLPVWWNDKVLTIDLQNQPLYLSQFSHSDGWELFQEMNSFAAGHLF